MATTFAWQDLHTPSGDTARFEEIAGRVLAGERQAETERLRQKGHQEALSARLAQRLNRKEEEGAARLEEEEKKKTAAMLQKEQDALAPRRTRSAAASASAATAAAQREWYMQPT